MNAISEITKPITVGFHGKGCSSVGFHGRLNWRAVGGRPRGSLGGSALEVMIVSVNQALHGEESRQATSARHGRNQ